MSKTTATLTQKLICVLVLLRCPYEMEGKEGFSLLVVKSMQYHQHILQACVAHYLYDVASSGHTWKPRQLLVSYSSVRTGWVGTWLLNFHTRSKIGFRSSYSTTGSSRTFLQTFVTCRTRHCPVSMYPTNCYPHKSLLPWTTAVMQAAVY